METLFQQFLDLLDQFGKGLLRVANLDSDNLSFLVNDKVSWDSCRGKLRINLTIRI